MSSNKPSIGTLDDFKPLNSTEECMVECAREGKWFVGTYSPDTTSSTDEGDQQDTVRGALVRFLILGGDENIPLHESGLKISNVIIDAEDVQGPPKKCGSIEVKRQLNLTGCEKVPLFSIKNCLIEGDLILDYASLSSVFLDGTVLNRLSAIRSTFNGSLYLRKNFTARMGVDLSGSTFKGSLSCRGGNFYPPSISDGDAPSYCFRVTDAIIYGTLILGPKSEPKGGASSEEVVELHGGLNLKSTTCRRFIDAESTYRYVIENNCNILLSNFSYELLGANTPHSYSFRKRWLLMQPKEDIQENFKPQPFEQMASVLIRMGFELDGREVSIFKHQLESTFLSKSYREEGFFLGWAKLFLHMIKNFLLKNIIGYGYKPANAIGYGLGFVLFGAVLFTLAHANGDIVPDKGVYRNAPGWSHCTNEIQGSPISWDVDVVQSVLQRSDALNTCVLSEQGIPNYQSFSPIWYSIDSFLPIVDLRQEDAWIPHTKSNLGWWVRFYLYFHIVIGWAVATLGFAGILGLVSNRGGPIKKL